MNHRDEGGRISPAQSAIAKSMRGNGAKRQRMKAIVKSRKEHYERPAGVKVYTEAGRRLKPFLPKR